MKPESPESAVKSPGKRRSGALVLFGACCVVLPFLLASAPSAEDARPAASWEYKTVSLLEELAARKRGLRVERRYRDIEKSLNKLGGEGWELCHAAEDLFIFKRPRSPVEAGAPPRAAASRSRRSPR